MRRIADETRRPAILLSLAPLVLSTPASGFQRDASAVSMDVPDQLRRLGVAPIAPTTAGAGLRFGIAKGTTSPLPSYGSTDGVTVKLTGGLRLGRAPRTVALTRLELRVGPKRLVGSIAGGPMVSLAVLEQRTPGAFGFDTRLTQETTRTLRRRLALRRAPSRALLGSFGVEVSTSGPID